MPTYRGISISLQSQYDALTIPEFPPPPPSSTPATPPKRRNAFAYTRSPASFSSPTPPRIAVVYVPIYSGSQFWINYACPTTNDKETKFFYFKLFVKGRCLLSWGVGEEDRLSGRVTFAIYDGGLDAAGKRVLEKKSFFFHNAATGQNRGGNFEIRVFRSKARKRETAKFEKFEQDDEDGAQNGFKCDVTSLGMKALLIMTAAYRLQVALKKAILRRCTPTLWLTLWTSHSQRSNTIAVLAVRTIDSLQTSKILTVYSATPPTRYHSTWRRQRGRHHDRLTQPQRPISNQPNGPLTSHTRVRTARSP